MRSTPEGRHATVARPRLRRPTINITPVERAGRIGIGLLGFVVGVVLLSGVQATATAALEVLLVVAGLDLIVTGALGHCPLYHRLGYVPSSLRRPK